MTEQHSITPGVGELLARMNRVEYKLDMILADVSRIVAHINKPKQQRNNKDFEYDDDFLDLWERYPRRAGPKGSKKATCQRLRARLAEGISLEAIRAGLERYIAFCEATGKTGTEYVMQPGTFFGPGERWADEFPLPVSRLKLPADDGTLVAFAEKHGLQKPGKLDNYHEYRRKLAEELRNKGL